MAGTSQLSLSVSSQTRPVTHMGSTFTTQAPCLLMSVLPFGCLCPRIWSGSCPLLFFSPTSAVLSPFFHVFHQRCPFIHHFRRSSLSRSSLVQVVFLSAELIKNRIFLCSSLGRVTFHACCRAHQSSHPRSFAFSSKCDDLAPSCLDSTTLVLHPASPAFDPCFCSLCCALRAPPASSSLIVLL